MTPQELKSSILQLAVQGRLVEQRPEEGTAEELYHQIQEEKQRLIKEGKIKKEKPLPKITEDEVPFDIPENWKWVRVGDIGSWSAGATPSRTKPEYYGGNVPWLKTGDLNDGYIESVPETITQLALDNTSVRLNPIGSVLMAMYGATIGKLGILSIPATTNQACCACIVCQSMYNKYLFYFLMASRIRYIKMGEGGAQPNISKEKIVSSLLPLPPLAEQKRIVAKIEELLPYIDRYEKAWSKLEDFNKRFPGDMQKSVLQMAIQGKLVEQRPEEGTGEELCRQIQAEKQSLIKAGKIKKEKPLPEISEDEIPFDIPESWKWVRLGSACSVVTGRLDANAQNTNGKYAFFTCGVEVYRTLEYAFDCDAVLLGGNNASGDYKMHRYCGKFNAYQRVYVITDPPSETLDYLFQVIKWWLPSLKHNSQGTTTRFIKLGQVTGMLVPLPPLAEQKRIVQKLEEILPLYERLK